jgi:hypothetical protein
MNHVPPLVGGLLSQQLHVGQQGVRFTPVPRARQAEAVQFLLSNAFATPTFLVKPELLRRMEPTGVMARVRNAQNSVMNSLLQSARIERLIEQSALDPAGAYAAVQFLADVRQGIWRELSTPARAIDPFRRNTQLVYLDTIDNRLNGGAEPNLAVRALLRGELRTLRGQIVAAIPSVTDRASRLHLEDARDLIDETLDPRAMRQRTNPNVATVLTALPGLSGWRFDYENDPFTHKPDTCWPDYAVR